ncbi:hypothetical protein KIH74_32250 [Kineosporia sp. J2-2]|uniref:Uncharacterized protein n=1 Tax=Kineosporia corallincola TaxID=2835133 RepID=A0ABS5TS99_9ACTN|nr:hypothetical protein [Kineosporia corallincola]MBT0773661.1 hypothetical protein [Kineosporia corallincola]
MRITTRLALATTALLTLGGATVAGASSASAATVNTTFCNSGSDFTYSVIFPQRGSWSTYVINPNSCLAYNGFFSPGEPYITRVSQLGTGAYRDTAGYTVWNCNERIELSGNYQGTNMTQQCV